MTAIAGLTDAEVIALLVGMAPPLTTEQRSALANQWRRDNEPCRPNPSRIRPGSLTTSVTQTPDGDPS